MYNQNSSVNVRTFHVDSWHQIEIHKLDESHSYRFILDWHFLNKIYFLYSGKKKNSREGISSYRSKSLNPAYISEISQLTEKVMTVESFSDFCALLKTHEKITGNQLGLIPIQEEYFTDFQGVVKSLGAWGGDFLMILTELPQSDIISYFKKKGFSTLFTYNELIFTENN